MPQLISSVVDLTMVIHGLHSEYCNSNTVYNKSLSCLDGDLFDCYPHTRFKGICYFVGVFCALFAVIGILGNLVTILALCYTSYKKM